MKNISKLLVGTALCVPLCLSAEMAILKDIRLGNMPLRKGAQTLSVNYNCPAGWTKVLDITHEKSKWRETTPVLICKPNKGLWNCPPRTYPYISGNSAGENDGEIGCMTVVW